MIYILDQRSLRGVDQLKALLAEEAGEVEVAIAQVALEEVDLAEDALIAQAEEDYKYLNIQTSQISLLYK